MITNPNQIANSVNTYGFAQKINVQQDTKNKSEQFSYTVGRVITSSEIDNMCLVAYKTVDSNWAYDELEMESLASGKDIFPMPGDFVKLRRYNEKAVIEDIVLELSDLKKALMYPHNNIDDTSCNSIGGVQGVIA